MDNRTIDEVRKNETKLINEIKVLETEIQKYKEVIDKAIEYIEWFRKDNMEFYKNKCVALTISECDGLLAILKEVE